MNVRVQAATVVHAAGPAFIKWGQWAATRPDMFPADLCRILAALQTGAPRHDFRYASAASELFTNPKPFISISQLLDHASFCGTWTYYAHKFDQADDHG